MSKLHDLLKAEYTETIEEWDAGSMTRDRIQYLERIKDVYIYWFGFGSNQRDILSWIVTFIIILGTTFFTLGTLAAVGSVTYTMAVAAGNVWLTGVIFGVAFGIALNLLSKTMKEEHKPL